MKNISSRSLSEADKSLSVLIHLAGESARLKKQKLMTQHFLKIQTDIASVSHAGPFRFRYDKPKQA
jgi:hypothetical protein